MNSQQMLMCMVRWAIFRDIQYGDDATDPWLKKSWRGGELPEVLMTHEARRAAGDMNVVRSTAAFVFKLVRRHGKRKDEPMAVTEAELAQFLQIARVNAYGVLDPLTQTSIGVGLFPSSGLINHSCTPNTDYLPSAGLDGAMTLVAIRPIKKGGEITITYTDLVTQPTQDRRTSLEEDYFFTCSCHRCNVDTGFDREILSSGGSKCVVKRVEECHDAVLSASTLDEGLKLYSTALEACNGDTAAPPLPTLHLLRWKSAHGVFIHAKEMENAPPLEMAKAILTLCQFHTAGDAHIEWSTQKQQPPGSIFETNGSVAASNPPPKSLQVSQVGLHLCLFKALVELRKHHPEEYVRFLKFAFASKATGLDLGLSLDLNLNLDERVLKGIVKCLAPFRINTEHLVLWWEREVKVQKPVRRHGRPKLHPSLQDIFYGVS
jgi:hypothetical protein